MVNEESTVLPALVAFEDEASTLSLANEVASLSLSRSSRPYHDKGWSNVYKDLDDIWMNGEIKSQWMRGKEEVKQMLLRCKDALGKESLRQEAFVE